MAIIFPKFYFLYKRFCWRIVSPSEFFVSLHPCLYVGMLLGDMIPNKSFLLLFGFFLCLKQWLTCLALEPTVLSIRFSG